MRMKKCKIKEAWKGMLERTYQRLTELDARHPGYLCTKELLAAGFSNRQIGDFVKLGYLEKVARGQYWVCFNPHQKPEEYKAIEVCRCNPNAVICADSACYYLGLIDVEPKRVSIGTARTDRRKMSVTFPFTRHYYGEDSFESAVVTVETDGGSYRIYDLDKSVCDCVRFRNTLEPGIFEMILEKYQECEQRQYQRLLEYAKDMQVSRLVRNMIKE